MYLRTKFVVHPLLWKFFPSLSLLASSRAITAIVALHITLAAFCLWFKCQCFSDHLWSARSVVSCHIMAGNFMEPSKLLLSNIILSEPESSILWAGCVDPPPPQPRRNLNRSLRVSKLVGCFLHLMPRLYLPIPSLLDRSTPIPANVLWTR